MRGDETDRTASGGHRARARSNRTGQPAGVERPHRVAVTLLATAARYLITAELHLRQLDPARLLCRRAGMAEAVSHFSVTPMARQSMIERTPAAGADRRRAAGGGEPYCRLPVRPADFRLMTIEPSRMPRPGVRKSPELPTCDPITGRVCVRQPMLAPVCAMAQSHQAN